MNVFQDGFCGSGIENNLGINMESRLHQMRERVTTSYSDLRLYILTICIDND